LQSRYYDPNIGRFINADDIQIIVLGGVLDFNILQYSLNNPIMFIDPNGFRPIDITKKLMNLMRTNALIFANYINKELLFRGIKGIYNSYKFFYNKDH